ncbi:MAG: tetratricopeptide repeat protein [Desulfobulbaceae bacterium]|jgi:cytochrome c-type biogenesis protein CcmH/NrfG|nr:tetratricopeptide repeat protein [Desulfobulbaceae bacterium]
MNPSSSSGKSLPILLWTVIFLCGFLAGVGFAAYKLRPAVSVGSEANSSPNGVPNSPAVAQAEAIGRLEAEVTAKPDNYQAWLRLGHLYYDSGQAEKAIQAYNRSLALHDGDADLYTDLGTMYRLAGQPEKAIASFDKACALDARHQQCRFNKGVVLFEMNKPEEALTSWHELLTISPDARTPEGGKVADLIKEMKKE